MRASVRQICALDPQPRCAWRSPAPSLPARHLGRGALAHLRAASWRGAPLVALRGGGAPSDSEAESSDDSDDLESSGDWVYDQSGQHMVKINPRDFDPDELRADFRNHTLRQLEGQLRQSLAAAREKGWRDATDEDDAMTDAEARGPSADAQDPAAGSVDISTLPEWLREALEKQTLPVEHAGITSFLEKYHEFASGAINTSNVEQGLAYVESKLEDERSPAAPQPSPPSPRPYTRTPRHYSPKTGGLHSPAHLHLHACTDSRTRQIRTCQCCLRSSVLPCAHNLSLSLSLSLFSLSLSLCLSVSLSVSLCLSLFLSFSLSLSLSLARSLARSFSLSPPSLACSLINTKQGTEQEAAGRDGGNGRQQRKLRL